MKTGDIVDVMLSKPIAHSVTTYRAEILRKIPYEHDYYSVRLLLNNDVIPVSGSMISRADGAQ